MMYYTQAYGKTIQSTIPLFNFTKDRLNNPNLSISYGEINSSETEFEEYQFRFYTTVRFSDSGVYLLWDGIDICLVTDNEIIVNSDSGIEEDYVKELILGPGIALYLHLQKDLILHASSVRVLNDGFAFMGINGLGKSTLTTALTLNGYPMISDDILNIDTDDNGFPVIFPGFSMVKLCGDAIEHFHQNKDDLPLIHSESDKRYLNVCYDSENMQLSLKRIYVLSRDDTINIRKLGPQESLVELLRNSYCANIFQNKDKVSNLNKYANIIEKVPIYQLNIPKNLDKIDELVKILEDHFTNQ